LREGAAAAGFGGGEVVAFVVGLCELQIAFSILLCEFDGDEGGGRGGGERSFDGDASRGHVRYGLGREDGGALQVEAVGIDGGGFCTGLGGDASRLEAGVRLGVDGCNERGVQAGGDDACAADAAIEACGW
jgi:hypothetical protein